ncbi:MAG: YHS domain-containing protein [Thermoplasmata archaeon]
MKTKDPVCGMTIESETAAAHASYRGTEIYFCSTACAAKYARTHPPS